MSCSETLREYVQKANAAGVEVAIVAPEELPGRLRALLSGMPSRVAVLPKSGWPQELLDAVRSALTGSGFLCVTPQRTLEGYSWNRDELAGASVGITFCRAFVAETGSLVFAAGPGAGTLTSALPETHLALSYPEGCRKNIPDCLDDLADSLPSRLTFITGPSRTGDIEATMTTGVHGPGRVLHWIIATASSLFV